MKCKPSLISGAFFMRHKIVFLIWHKIQISFGGLRKAGHTHMAALDTEEERRQAGMSETEREGVDFPTRLFSFDCRSEERIIM